MLKPEEINGKMYQPKEREYCATCVFCINDNCDAPLDVKCHRYERPDGLNVYYINIEGE